MTGRAMMSSAAGAALLLLCAATCNAGEAGDPEKTAAQAITPAAQRAIDRGLAWLTAQQHADGGFGAGSYQGNTGVTALAGMAFLASGSTPGRGPHGRAINRTVDYLLAAAQPSGFLQPVRAAGAGHGPMYGHGFATLFLAECDGMSSRPELRETLAKAVRLIIDCQNDEGGWRYFPNRDDADVSVTVCQLMALRAVRNAGIEVPKQTIDRAVDYIKRCQTPDGGFMYQCNRPDRESAFPRSAAAVAALESAGMYDAPEIRKGLDYLLRFVPGPSASHAETYYDYGHYYAVQVMWQTGGAAWNRWYPAIRDDLVARQRGDGAWNWLSTVSTEATTAMCSVVLEMPNNCLPIFQR